MKALDFSFSTGFLFSKKKKCVKVDCVIAAMTHDEFEKMMNERTVLVDVQGMFDEKEAKGDGFYYRRV